MPGTEMKAEKKARRKESDIGYTYTQNNLNNNAVSFVVTIVHVIGTCLGYLGCLFFSCFIPYNI